MNEKERREKEAEKKRIFEQTTKLFARREQLKRELQGDMHGEVVEMRKSSAGEPEEKKLFSVREVDERIKELELVKEGFKEAKLAKADRERRLALLEHPFVQRVRDTLYESMVRSSEVARKKAYDYIDKKKREAIDGVAKQIRYSAYGYLDGHKDDPGVSEEQLLKMVKQIMKESREPPKGMVV